uniref:hypothetical protein n=1 Tax=Helicobacter typhlonius TaxID=76936 RepID=UPI002FE33E5D
MKINYLNLNINNYNLIFKEFLKKLNISKNYELIVLLIYFLKRASIFTDNEIKKKILKMFQTMLHD